MRRVSSFLISLGFFLIFTSIAVFIFTFYPVIFAEIKYQLAKLGDRSSVVSIEENAPNGKNVIKPVDEEFGIVIPKIGANAKVIENVDPYDPQIYQKALTGGVAHAKGTVFPGNFGNIFIFSHSSVNFYEANRYNSIFYLLSKMEKGDEVYIFFHKQKFMYKVTDKKIVAPQEVSYLSGQAQGQILTLMTCWPAGTTFKRLLVIGKLSS